MFNDFTSYEKAAIKETKVIVNKKLSAYKNWKGINLQPALERHIMIWFLYRFKSLENALFSKTNVWEFFKQHYSKKQGLLKNTISNSLLLSKLKDYIKYGSLFRKKLKSCKIAIFIHHPKFSKNLSNYKLGLKSDDIVWIAVNRFNEIKNSLPNNTNVIKLPIGIEASNNILYF